MTPRNPGNTGHRYRMQPITSVEVKGTEVTVSLWCGHQHVYNETYATDHMIAWWQKQVGKNQRCSECVKQTQGVKA